MPHISLKMLKGRTAAQKQAIAESLRDALKNSLCCPENFISVSIEEFTPAEWQEVFKTEMTDKKENIVLPPAYDPKSLL